MRGLLIAFKIGIGSKRVIDRISSRHTVDFKVTSKVNLRKLDPTKTTMIREIVTSI